MSTSEQPPDLIPLLPSDVARECLARILLWQHPKLSILSKSIKSILKSPLFFSSRTKLNCTEHVLHLTLRSSTKRDSWYILYRKPDPNPNPFGQDFKILAVQIPPNPNPSFNSQIIILDRKIYVLGGFRKGVFSSDVWVLDCRFNTWEQGPRLPMTRHNFMSGAINGKIHLSDPVSIKAFDPVSGLLEEFLMLEDVKDFKGRRLLFWYIFIAGGRFYCNVNDGEVEITVLYEPTTNTWIGVGKDEDLLLLDFGYHRNFCEIDGVLYYCDSFGKIKGFNVGNEDLVLKDLRGVDEELIFPDGMVANVGGRLVVVWKKEKRVEKEEEGKRKSNGDGEEEEKEKEVDIWYAEIELKNLEGGDLRGEILFSQKILSASCGSKFVHFASVSV